MHRQPQRAGIYMNIIIQLSATDNFIKIFSLFLMIKTFRHRHLIIPYIVGI